MENRSHILSVGLICAY